MKKNFICSSVLCALLSTFAVAQDQPVTATEQLQELVISDSKFALKKEKSGKVISKITAADIKNNPGQNLPALLNTIAGVEINGNQNGAGKNLGYFIRGGRSSQVLILIDGVPLVDASGISLQYDLRFIDVNQVESVEVMKGASSVLYGSGAATGVISITLKKNKSNKPKATALVNAGSNRTATSNGTTEGTDFNSGFSVSGNVGKTNMLFSVNNTELNGISQVANVGNSNFEADRFSKLNLMSKVNIAATRNLDLNFFGNYDKFYNDYDLGFDNTNKNDTNINNTVQKQFRFGFAPEFRYEKGILNVNSSFSITNRSFEDFSTFSNTINTSNFASRSVNVDIFNKYNFSENFFLVLGSQYQFHDMSVASAFDNIAKKSTKFNMIDPYANFVFNTAFGLNLNAGARLNIHSEYGNELVYNVNPSYSFQNLPLKLVSSISTAFVTPSLYQLYSQYGNLNLTPEKNRTIEAGFETKLFSKKMTWNVVGFYREQTNFIGFFSNPLTFAGNYVNIVGENKAKGIESEISASILKNLKLTTNYTFTQVDVALDRLIPKHKVNANLNYAATERLRFNTSFQYLSARKDAFFDGNTFRTVPVLLRDYKLVNVSTDYDLIKNRLNVFANVTNLFNEDFIENIGFSARGRNFRLGMTFNF